MDTDLTVKKMPKGRKILLIVAAVIAVLIGVAIVYSIPAYFANAEAAAVLEEEHENVTISTDKKNMIAFVPDEPAAGLIFYPGAKIQYQAYSPLMEKLAENGILCVMLKMPFNLAIAGVDSADGVREMYPDIDEWYMAGHSLGGVGAGMYLGKHADEFEGYILLASYCTTDLSDTDLDVLSVYGSKDRVLELDRYEENKVNLPEDFKEVVIEGGNHAFFGSYGEQDGDGLARISNEEQTDMTVELITELVNK